jgi:outer membrane protein assembly factor BamB
MHWRRRGRKGKVVKVPRGPAAWARRALLALVLVGAAVIPGRASSQQEPHCTGLRCTSAGSVLWTRPLPGSWIAQSGVSGTVTDQDAAYAAVGDGVAVVGSGTWVSAYQTSTGKRLWHFTLAGLPSGSAIVSLRALTGVVAVGVAPPAGQNGPARDEVILAAATGKQIRIYPAAAYGGAVEADRARTVIVGSTAVTAYANSSGGVLWRRAIGPGAPTWRVSGQYLYVADPSSRSAATSSGVSALRRISLVTGAELIVRPRPRPPAFAGTLSGAIDIALPNRGQPQEVVLFSGSDGVVAFDGQSGEQRWRKDSAVLELTDSAQDAVYLGTGSSLTGIDALSGAVISHAPLSVAASLYWVSDGVALGLDQNALGEAWGYSLSAGRVLWTSPAVPWPHFFVDLSGLGGSATQASDVVVLATCARVGAATSAGGAAPCARPQLSAVLMRSR